MNAPFPTQDQIIMILLQAAFGFFLAMSFTPIFTYFAFKYQWWRKARVAAVTGEKAKVFSKLHAHKHKRHIPTMAGLIIIAAVVTSTLLFNLDRNQTWLPLAALILFGGLGLIDDLSNILGKSDKSGGLKARTQLIVLVLLAFVLSLWFYFKLGYNLIHIPAYGDISIGVLYIPLFIMVVF